MALIATENGAYDSIDGAPSPATSGTTLTVHNSALWPDPLAVGPYGISLCPSGVAYSNDVGERCIVTGKSGAVLTIVRAQEASTARTIAVGWQVFKSWGSQDGRGALMVGARNLLRNPGFALCQRGAPAGFAVSSGTYGPDGWYVLTQTAAITYARSSSTAFHSPYDGVFTQSQLAAQRCGALQVIGYDRTYAMRGEKIRFDFMAAAAPNMTIRYAIIEWTGTADSVTKTIVNDWTSTNYTAGNFFTSTTKNILATGSLPITGTGALCSIRATVGASANNLIVFFWSSATMAQFELFVVSDAWLVPDTLSAPFMSRPMADEIVLCQRYYQKSYDLDTAPGAANNNVGIRSLNLQATEASNVIAWTLPFHGRMRVAPTVTTYDYAGNSGKISELSSSFGVVTNNVTPSGGVIHNGENGCGIAHDPSGNIGGVMYHLTADAEL